MLLGRAGLSPVMVGRAAELAVLRERVASLGDRPGPPPVVVISGEAGVGKTRLLRELEADIARTMPEVAFLAGNAEESDLARPFGLLATALAHLLPTWDPLPEPLEHRAHALGHVLAPLLSEHPPSTDHEHTNDELLLAATEAVRHAVGGGPAVMLLEDLHWADAESVELLLRLATLPELPLVIVGTFRPEDFDRRHPLARALPALERHRTVTHLALGRLGDGELASMLEAILGEPVPSATVKALQQRTQGNPFFVEELLATSGDASGLADVPLPWNAAEAVLRRVDTLDAETRRTLEAAAILGTRVPFDRLAAVSGLTEDALIVVLRTLVDRGLLSEVEPDLFAFRHALTREAVTTQLLGREQRRIHQAALAALDAEAAAHGAADGVVDLPALARHAQGAGEWGRLAEIATEGAPRLLREGAARQALALATMGLERCEQLSDEAELRLHGVAAQAAWQGGALDQAQRHAELWRRLAAAADAPAEESAALRQLAVLHHVLGDTAGREAALARALEAAERLGPSVELAWVLSYLSQSHMFARREAEALALADRALAMAADIGAHEVVPYTLVNKGTVLTELDGRAEEGLALLDEARRTAVARHDAVTAARALNNASRYLLELARDGVGRARLLIEESDRLLARYGIEAYAAPFAVHKAQLAIIDGDLAAAEAALTDVDLPEEFVPASIVVSFRSTLAAERGDMDSAWAALDSLTLGERSAGAEEALWYALARVAVAARSGDTATVERALGVLLQAPEEDTYPGLWFPQVACNAVISAAPTAVDDAPLVSLMDVLSGVRPADDMPVDTGWVVHAEAAMHRRGGRHAEAVTAYRRARQGQVRQRPAWLRADLALGLAHGLAALGERAEAAAEAAEAIRLLERWPGWRRDEAEDLQRRLVASAEPAGMLTPREAEVLGLVAEGLSNREIGERLYITTKTAAVHVSNILAKVGAASRTEAATWALRTGALEKG